MIKVSACIVTYNNSDKAKRAVQSLLEHTKGVQLSLYIVDNNSSDDTVKVLRQSYPDVRIIEMGKNSGFGKGHNAVLPLLDSHYHAIVNPDIVIDSDVLTKMCKFMEDNKQVGLLTPKVLNLDGTQQHLAKRKVTLLRLIANRTGWRFLEGVRKKYTMQDEDLFCPTEIEQASGCFMLIRTELFKELKGFDERFFMYFEDFDLSRRVNLVSKVVYYPETYVYHEWERGGAKNIRLLLVQISSMFKYFFKWAFRIRK